MASKRSVFHTFTAQLRAVLPDLRATRTTTLALLILGLLWAESVSLPRIAATLPLPAQDSSLERRLRRLLANTALHVVPVWHAVLPRLLADCAGQELVFVFDPTPQNNRATILCLGLLVRHRVLPVAWRVVAQQEQAWPKRQATYVRILLHEVNAALPAGCTATLLADRGVSSAGVIDACRTVGWHYVLRLNAREHRGAHIRQHGQTRPLWDLVTAPGQRWQGRVQVFREAGWRSVWLTIHWAADARSPWVLITDVPGRARAARLYRRRMRCEATYEDLKRRGFNIEASKLQDLDRLNRLLLALHLAYWWAEQLGLRVIRRGQRRRYDRVDRRDKSVLRLGLRVVADLLEQGKSPPLPFRWHAGAWRFTFPI